jgi:predicted MFS family arabinose efflux permease
MPPVAGREEPNDKMTATATRRPAGLAVGWLTMFVVGTDLFVVSPLLPMIAAEYRLSPGAAGLAVTVFSLTYMLSAPLFGHLADRWGRRPVLLCCLAAFAAANLATASAGGFAGLLLARIAAGAAAAGVSPAVYALVGGAAPPERRASWMALVVSGLLLSLALGAPLGAWAGALIGWKAVFGALAWLSLCLIPPNLLAWRGESAPCGETGAADALPAMIVIRRLLPMVLWSTALYGMYTYLGTGLAAAGLSIDEVARAILLYGSGAIAGVLIGGRLADRFGARVMAAASLLLLAAAFLVLQLAVHQGVVIALALALTSALAQLFFPAQQAGLAKDFPRRRASVLAWNNSALFFGIMLGSLVGGQVVGVAGFEANLVVCAAIALSGAAVVGGIGSLAPARLRRAGYPV